MAHVPKAFDFSGEVAIVSGAGSRMAGEIGNGRATAILLARQGAKVALLDNNVEWVQETKRMIDGEGGISEVIQVDVTVEESCKAAVAKTIELFGTVHVLVNVGRQLYQISVHVSLYSQLQSVSAVPWATQPRSIWMIGTEICASMSRAWS